MKEGHRVKVKEIDIDSTDFLQKKYKLRAQSAEANRTIRLSTKFPCHITFVFFILFSLSEDLNSVLDCVPGAWLVLTL